MTNTNSLPYYPRFIFNCNDGKCFSTGDLDHFKFIKESGSEYDITRFTPGQEIDIYWNNHNESQEKISYSVNKIEIHQIKYDLDKPTKGMNSNDCAGISGRNKKWMMEIYVFLDILK